MNFLEMVQIGVAKSNKAIASASEVDRLFEEINVELMSYPHGAMKLERRASLLSEMKGISSNLQGKDSKDTLCDELIISIKVGTRTYMEKVSGWKQRIEGFPCVLVYEGQELTCSSYKELSDCLGELLSSISVGNVVNRFLKIT